MRSAAPLTSPAPASPVVPSCPKRARASSRRAENSDPWAAASAAAVPSDTDGTSGGTADSGPSTPFFEGSPRAAIPWISRIRD
ncbi:MAG: hypothetical protein ACLFRY_12810 [Spirochaetia bacterium]